MKNKLVIFDWGGVIESHRKSEYCVNKARINLIKHFNNEIKDKDLLKKERTIYINNKMGERNDVTTNWFNELKKEFSLKCSYEEFYSFYLKEFDKVEYYKDVVQYAHTLKQICKIGILSNLSSLDKQRLDKQVDLKQFDYVWLSFEMNCRKPNKRIYEMVEKECKFENNNILFIDDCKENINVAKKMGWNTCNADGHELYKIKKSINKFLKKEID